MGRPELQQERITPFQAFAWDVENGTYPQARREPGMDDAGFERFLTLSNAL